MIEIKLRKNDKIIPFHFFHKKEFQFIYVLSGKGKLNIGGKNYLIAPYQLFFISSEIPYYYVLDKEMSYERYEILLDKNFPDQFFLDERKEFLNLFSSLIFTQSNQLDITSHQIQILKLIGQYMNYDGLLKQSYQKMKAMEIVHWLLNSWSEVLPTMKYSFKDVQMLREMTQYIDQHLPTLTIGELAGNFYMSESNLYKIFQKVTGYGPKTYFNQKRLERACCLLETEKEIQKICEEVGFKNYLTFNRSFQSFLGMSPSFFRKQQKDADFDPILSQIDHT